MSSSEPPAAASIRPSDQSTVRRSIHSSYLSIVSPALMAFHFGPANRRCTCCCLLDCRFLVSHEMEANRVPWPSIQSIRLTDFACQDRGSLISFVLRLLRLGLCESRHSPPLSSSRLRNNLSSNRNQSKRPFNCLGA